MRDNPKCSLIIPTRERAETLFYTIKTALNQVSKDYEILISDNFSQDKTPEIVSNFNDDRIRYINPGRRLSMTDHWNFAIAEAKGDYIIVIGDDDAVMPGAIDRFIHAIGEHPCKVYSWPTHVYIWPMGGVSAKFHQLVRKQPISRMDLKAKVGFATKYGLCNYLPRPHLYHSAVHKSVLEKIYLRTGNFFQTTTPDVYMSYVLPVLEDASVILGESITVIGHSPKSNSGNIVNPKNQAEVSKYFKEYESYELHPSVPTSLYRGSVFMLDTIFVARELFPEFYESRKLNRNAMLAFLYLSFKQDTLRSLFKNKRLISRNYSFNFGLFVLYILLFKIYKTLKGITVRQSFDNQYQNIEPNIYDFVMGKHVV